MNIQRYLLAGVAIMLSFGLYSQDGRSNIVLIIADDMGYSDIGCYGSEIETPHAQPLKIRQERKD